MPSNIGVHRINNKIHSFVIRCKYGRGQCWFAFFDCVKGNLFANVAQLRVEHIITTGPVTFELPGCL